MPLSPIVIKIFNHTSANRTPMMARLNNYSNNNYKNFAIVKRDFSNKRKNFTNSRIVIDSAKWPESFKRALKNNHVKEKLNNIPSNVLRILNGRKIKTEKEHIEFLKKVRQNMNAEDLANYIQVLYRGTTRSENGEIFKGNPNSIENGTSTSTDPMIAVIFGIESSSKYGTKGVLQMYLTKNLKGLKLSPPNYRVAKEREVIINTSPENLSKFVKKEFPIEYARKLINEIYGINIPKTITSNSIPNSNMLLEEIVNQRRRKAQEFYTKVIK